MMRILTLSLMFSFLLTSNTFAKDLKAMRFLECEGKLVGEDTVQGAKISNITYYMDFKDFETQAWRTTGSKLGGFFAITHKIPRPEMEMGYAQGAVVTVGEKESSAEIGPIKEGAPESKITFDELIKVGFGSRSKDRISGEYTIEGSTFELDCRIGLKIAKH